MSDLLSNRMGLVVLAQSNQSLSKLWVWIVILLVVVFVGAIAIFWLRRSLLSPGNDTTPNPGSLLDHLRELHEQGEMSDEEFKAARAKLLGEHTPKPEPDETPDRPDSR